MNASMNDQVKMKISLNGPMTKEYIDLHALGIALINIQSMFDRSYGFYTGHKRISSSERKKFKIVAYEVKRGSIIFDAGLLAFTLQQSLAITQTIDPQMIFKATVSGFKYLYNYLSQTKKNNIPKVNIVDSPGAVCNYIEGSNTIITSPETLEIAQRLRPPLRRMSGVFGQEKGALNISSNICDDAIYLNQDNVSLFKNNYVLSNIPLKIKGVVKSFSIDTHSGQFDILEECSIPKGKYTFFVQEDDADSINIFIDSLKGAPINVIAFVEYDISPAIQSTITKLFLKPDMSQP